MLVLTCSGHSQSPPTNPTPAEITSTPLNSPITNSKLPFSKIPSSHSTVDFENRIDTHHPLKRLYHSGFACGGVAIGDIDGDSKPDLFFVSGPDENRLYRQIGDFQFEDITENAGVDGGDTWGAGAAMADVDNDGDLDIYVCNYNASSQLFINDGTGKFSEEAERFGLNLQDAFLMPAFADYDLDGYLDVYLLSYRLYREGGRPAKEEIIQFRDGYLEIVPEFRKYYGLMKTGPDKHSVSDIGRPDKLLRHNGSTENPKYIDVTEKSGIANLGMGLSVTWWDYNTDGFPDIYVGNDFFAPDYLWRNNGNGTFTNVIQQAIPHTTWSSMGAAAADVNNDGYPDLLSADMAGTTHFKEKMSMGLMDPVFFKNVAGPPPQMMRNALYLGTGTRRFIEAAYLVGVATSDWTWSVKFADLDNDGWEDLFLTNGMTRDFTNSDIPFTSSMMEGRTEWEIYENTPARREQNLAYRNDRNLHFTDVSQDWNLGHLGLSYVAAHADLDRDGDLDLVMVNLDEPVIIYKNESVHGSRILIQLRGSQSNLYGIGATVHLKTKVGTQIRHNQPVSGFLASNEPIIHFGLGKARIIDELTVSWPSGHHQRFANLEVNEFYTITEPEGAVPKREETPSPPSYFKRSATLSKVKHVEAEFDDFTSQRLLPNRLSQLGPGMAWGDLDGDGDDDLYVGGTAGQPGQLILNQGDGNFAFGENPAFDLHAAAEDMGALFFDIDQDDDLDLYVVSGGVEHDKESNNYQDRVYVNKGNGDFSNILRSAFTDSGSVVAAADFDRDGDLDFFVGGRVVPGEYPRAPISRLQRNKTEPGGEPHFIDVTNEIAPGLENAGMVTSALWSDANGDGWIDLLVTCEWGPVRLWLNREGTFEEVSENAGLSNYTGWWNGITARDFDNDGDMDYAVTNFGLNTKYKASSSSPVKLFYGPFGDEQKPQIIEAKFEADTLYPVRGKSCSTNAMPHLAEQFTTFHQFAQASLYDIYSTDKLDEAQEFSVNTLESGVFLNDGNAHFTFVPLPRIAQVSPGFGVVATEVNGDSNADLYLVQNFFGPQVETGRMDGGMSLLLLGKGDGTFKPIWPKESGLIVSGDATSLTLTDLNGDGRLDFVVGVNNEEIMTFERSEVEHEKVFTIRTIGRKGNRSAVGSRVTVELSDGSRQTAEVHAGSGYLSQSSITMAFGLGAAESVKAIHVRWPDGSKQTIDDPRKEGKIALRQPDGFIGSSNPDSDFEME